MSDIEVKLQKLANRLAQEDQSKYDSRFISIVHSLQNNMNVSEVRKGGSRAKLTHVAGKGDLDIIFTYVKPDLTSSEVFLKTRKVLVGNFSEIAQITSLDVSVQLYFPSDDIKIDVVYLQYSEFRNAVEKLNEIKEADNIKHDAIRLIKYWNEEEYGRKIKPMDIEDTILSWNYKSLYNFIVQYGESRDMNMMILSWLEKQI